ncbi:MAG TPA: sigma-70 family RNA polymerase sigma factor [Acidimicrobiales bacterium]|nr:sigma-70 family RNA polymerase sigma factor [Acidimicrobiales bacterium]
MSTEEVADWVRQAQAGDAEAFGRLVVEFQDVVTALCVGALGDLDLARDAAQEAFVTALGSLGGLREPQAFPAWLFRVARTCARRVGGAGRPQVGPLVQEPVGEEDPSSDRTDAEVVRAALGQLRPADRTVLALAYLGGYPQAAIAEFLSVPVSTVKKRAFDARRRLKGLLPMVEATLGSRRPSGTPAFSNVVLLYAAIRRGDAEEVTALIGADASLVEAEETWDVAEGRAAGLVFPRRATPLVRAAEAGHLAIVEALLAAGAAVDGPCGCETGETPLWAATVNGHTEVVARLLAAGADPNRQAGPGLTGLHVAARRGRHDLAELLLAHGADPELADGTGRTARQWAEAARPASAAPAGGIVPVGIKALDLFAPLPRSGLVCWHGSYGLGQQVLLAEIATALAPAGITWVGFECDLLDRIELAHLRDEAGLAEAGFTVNLLPPDLSVDDEAALLEAAIAGAERRAVLSPQTLVLVDHPARTAALEAYLPRLKGNPAFLTTIFLTPRFGAGEPPERPPAGFDAQVVLDPERLRRRFLPAVDLQRSSTVGYPSDRHRDIADRARQVLRAGGPLAERVDAYLTQPLRVGEPFLGQVAAPVPVEALLDDVAALLAGRHSDRAAQDLMYGGRLAPA